MQKQTVQLSKKAKHRTIDCCKLLWQSISSLDIGRDAVLSFRNAHTVDPSPSLCIAAYLNVIAAWTGEIRPDPTPSLRIAAYLKKIWVFFVVFILVTFQSKLASTLD